MTAEEKFYAHLDLCEQCREHPFDLCEAGARLLEAAGQSLTPTGRYASSEPVLQDLPLRTEVGRSLREAFKKEFGGPIHFIENSTSALEHRVFKRLSEQERRCFLCDAGVPFSKPKKS